MKPAVKPFSAKSAARPAMSFIFFWAAGLGFLWWLIAPVFMALKSKTKLRSSAETNILVALGIWLVLIICASILGGVVSANRIPGAAYGALVWIAAGIAFHALRKLTPEQNFFFIRGLIFIGSVQGALTFAAVHMHPSPLSQIMLPSAPLISGAGGVGAWAQSNLAYVDYFGGGIVRSSGMMATAAWSGGYACLILVLLVLGRKQLLAAGMNKLAWLAAVTLNISSLYYSYSRVSIAILAAVILVYVAYRVCAVIDSGGLLATIILTTAAVAAFNLFPWQDYLTDQDSLRPGSSSARFTSYAEGLDVAQDEGFLVLLAGNGVKPFLEDLGRGAGSESTYVSLLVRGGLVAVTLFACFLLARLGRAWRSRDWVGVLLISALAVHAMVEDLDIGTLTLLLILIEPARMALTAKPIPAPAYRSMVTQR